MSRTIQIPRESILKAAMKVIMKAGLTGLTLDATAKEASISKGGVLYRYHSKDELLADLVRFTIEELFTQVKEVEATDPNPTGRWLRSYLKASFSPIKPNSDFNASELDRFYSAVFATIASNPHYIHHPGDWQATLEHSMENDRVDLVDHYITLLAIDGLCFWRLLGLLPGDALQASVIERLEQRTKEKINTKPKRTRNSTTQKTTKPTKAKKKG